MARAWHLRFGRSGGCATNHSGWRGALIGRRRDDPASTLGSGDFPFGAFEVPHFITFQKSSGAPLSEYYRFSRKQES